MANTLIIGLGGTGGKIIREFRKRYFEEFKSFEPQDGSYIDYLYVDSDEGDLRTAWRTQGVSIGLSNAQKVSTHGMNSSDLDQLEDRPQLQGFISVNEVDLIKEKLGKIISEGIGGQRRRLGRMLMASHIKQDDGFVSKLKGRVASLQNRSNQNDVHFHICAGLAGGTGSGSIVDTIAQIRQIYGDGPQIHLYIYVPERQTVYSDNVEYYQANGYAALLELNALTTGHYNPVDITGVRDPYTNDIRRINSSSPITGMYLFSNVNERGRMLSIKNEQPELYQMVADFLFQKIYVDKDSSLNKKLLQVEKFENGDPTEEKDANGRRVRSVRNLSFGFKRVIFPEREIKEYIAYEFAERTALQMHFQHWTSGGYTTVSREDATAEITSKLVKEDREKLYLSDSILMRESSLPGDETVQTFSDTYVPPTAGFSRDALKKPKSEWVNYFNGMMGDFFKKKFRRMGVVDYFAQETVDSPKYARKIVHKIEQELFKRWEEGSYGALQLEEYIKLLLKDIDKRLSEFTKQQEASEKKQETMATNLSAQQKEVTDPGFFGDLLGKRQDRFVEYCEARKRYYIERTRCEAIKYAIVLLGNIKIALQELEENIIRFSALLSTMTEKAHFQAAQRCGEESANDAKTLRKYDKSAVDDIKDKAIRNEDTQAQIARNVRNALVAELGDIEEKGFVNFLKTFGAFDNLDLSADNVMNVIFDVCIRGAEKEVENRSSDDQRFKVTNVNILEKLRQEYDDPSGEKLRAFAHELMESARTFIKRNDSEVTRLSNGNVDKTMTAYIVYLPEEIDKKSNFRDRLFNAFRDAIGGDKVTLASSHRNDQLAIMTLCSLFPLRHVDNLTVLKEAYDRLIKGNNSDIHSLVLHTETFKEPLPSLYEASVAEMATELPKPVMLGFAMGIIKESTDSRTGRKAYYLFTVDKYGDQERSELPLGKDFNSVVKGLLSNRKEAGKLQDEVKRRLKTQYVHIDAKAALMKEVNNVLRSIILEACGGDEFSPEYVKYKKVRNSLGDNELNTED